MFEKFSVLAGDPIIGLIDKYNRDPNPSKIDVGIGVFKNRTGQTPVMQAVKRAEVRLNEREQTKAYLGISGNEKFNQAMKQLVFADSVSHDRIAAVQAPGGTGALRISADTLIKQFSHKTVWISDKTWGNHLSIFTVAGANIKRYDYFDPESRLVNEEKLIDFVKTLTADDVLLLHGCCHNPTGADLSLQAWQEITDYSLKNGFLPFVDLAYQGLGDGLDDDVAGLRYMAAKAPEMIVTSSCSKNFGLYRERTGCALWLTKDKNTADVVEGNIGYQARIAYSMPPNYGAEMVADILTNTELTKLWQDELASMRGDILYNRQKLAEILVEKTGDSVWEFVKKHKGMFSLFNLPKQQTDQLIHEHSIYLVAGGRINIAGLSSDEVINRFADCLIQTLKA